MPPTAEPAAPLPPAPIADPLQVPITPAVPPIPSQQPVKLPPSIPGVVSPQDPYQPPVVPEPVHQPTPPAYQPPAVPDPAHQPTPPAYQPPAELAPQDPYQAGAPPAAEPEAYQQPPVAPSYQPPSEAPSPYGGQPQAVQQQLKAQDVLVAVAEKEGPEAENNLQANVVMTDICVAAKQEMENNKRTKKNTRKGKNQPKFLRINTRFAPGRPLVVSFTSPKGGVAKSTTAANYAAYIAKAAELSGVSDQVRVLLVDGDVANGNLALRVAQRLKPNLLDMVVHMDELHKAGAQMTDFERDISPFVLGHPKISNLDILAAPENPEVIAQLRQEDLDELMSCWAQMYNVVVFDTGTQINEFTNCAWLRYSSQVYLMTEPELACLNSTLEYTKRAQKVNLITPDVCRVICVRADMEIDNISPQEFVSEVFSMVPPNRQFYWPDFHRDAISAGNAGEFLTLDSAEYAAEMTAVVKQSLSSYEQDFGT